MLLADYAPTVSMEQLEYDTRLMNVATARGEAHVLRNLFVASDRGLDPQALVLDPDVVIPVAREIVRASNPVEAARNACLRALDLIEDAARDGTLRLDAVEWPWLGTLRDDLESIPDSEDAFVERMQPRLDPSKLILAEYGL
jgi:methanol--5-hydroxybenzimidazolylcobamide Co-methyltransferase